MAATTAPNIPRAKREGSTSTSAAVCAAGTVGARRRRPLPPQDLRRVPATRRRPVHGAAPRRRRCARPGAGRRARRRGTCVRGRLGALHHPPERGAALGALGRRARALRAARAVGLVGRSACGHTIRNVLACPEAATSSEEPFDVSIDAAWLSQQLVARSRELNVALPNRLNISLGGCTACGLEALTNDIGLVACVRDGEPGYQLWAGGSLGTAPRLSLMLRPFVARDDLWPAVWSIIEWFVTEGDVEQVAKGRLKFLVEARGEHAFRAAFTKRFAAMRDESRRSRPPRRSTCPRPTRRCCVLGQAPTLGWRDGIRPERRAGYASITVRVPLGDLLADDLVALAQVAPDRPPGARPASRTCSCRRCRRRRLARRRCTRRPRPRARRRAGRSRRARLSGPVVLLAGHHRQSARRHRDRAGDQRPARTCPATCRSRCRAARTRAPSSRSPTSGCRAPR